MDWWILVLALIQGIVEGLTEFLPVSSTGHLIVSGALIGFTGEKAKVFEVVIQVGAILAIFFEYRQRVWQLATGVWHDPKEQRFFFNIVISFIPAAVLGVLFASTIKSVLFNPLTVAGAFIVGGVIMIWAEKRTHRITVATIDDVRWQDALKVGLAQCLSLIPGTSRSGATIVGALLFGYSRKAATEFSFFLSIPMIFGAAVYDGWKSRELFTVADLPMFAVGFIAAFFSAWLCVRWLLRFISTHTFIPLAWYRIAFGFVILLTAGMGWVNWHAP